MAKSSSTSNSTPANPFGDIAKMMESFKLPGVDIDAVMEARRKDMEALVEANRAAYESMQAIGAKQAEMFKAAMQSIQDSGKTALSSSDPTKHAELARKAYEKALLDMKELAELARKSQTDAMAHISSRANEHVAEIRKMMTAKK
ncbi:phasin family protein [Pelomonas sp. KK5]|uniref:phasin family protein n=1 Tax=Pelomonas sp. KK5 TaxID=1855730 RepID=UPI00097C8486|nr:TIGR01841 family phasin [Pelomonas sp. KK5]